jgi:hypothetical protein
MLCNIICREASYHHVMGNITLAIANVQKVGSAESARRRISRSNIEWHYEQYSKIPLIHELYRRQLSSRKCKNISKSLRKRLRK